MSRLLLRHQFFRPRPPARRDDSGATMAEYALMIGLIALVVFAAVQALGLAVNSLFAGFPTLP